MTKNLNPATKTTNVPQPLARAIVEKLFTTEVAASFAVSPTPDGDLVAHVHWQNQMPVSSWQDVLRLHEESHYWPCFFDGAFDTLVQRDGQPADDLTRRIFTEADTGDVVGVHR